jgi:hypothetical protein
MSPPYCLRVYLTTLYFNDELRHWDDFAPRMAIDEGGKSPIHQAEMSCPEHRVNIKKT